MVLTLPRTREDWPVFSSSCLYKRTHADRRIPPLLPPSLTLSSTHLLTPTFLTPASSPRVLHSPIHLLFDPTNNSNQGHSDEANNETREGLGIFLSAGHGGGGTGLFLTYISAIITGVEAGVFAILNIVLLSMHSCTEEPPEKLGGGLDTFWDWYFYDEQKCQLQHENYTAPSWINATQYPLDSRPRTTMEENIKYQITYLALHSAWLLSCLLLIYGNARKLWANPVRFQEQQRHESPPHPPTQLPPHPHHPPILNNPPPSLLITPPPHPHPPPPSLPPSLTHPHPHHPLFTHTPPSLSSPANPVRFQEQQRMISPYHPPPPSPPPQSSSSTPHPPPHHQPPHHPLITPLTPLTHPPPHPTTPSPPSPLSLTPPSLSSPANPVRFKSSSSMISPHHPHHHPPPPPHHPSPPLTPPHHPHPPLTPTLPSSPLTHQPLPPPHSPLTHPHHHPPSLPHLSSPPQQIPFGFKSSSGMIWAFSMYLRGYVIWLVNLVEFGTGLNAFSKTQSDMLIVINRS
ncbi:hypothetical protein C7M84_006323 [Penaeus vannamei]|uniref:Uncharacterized protein n=1 Tax=Penaeus vannamei TaxID=6689 RepID=A0A3R7PRZ9_PENVA|nr:hypothetical protein C7M84_006323 [Penaeus vannamei]